MSEILSSNVKHGTFFKSSSNSVYAVTSEYDSLYRLESCGDFIFVMKGSADKLATYLNRSGFKRVPLEITSFDCNRLSGNVNGKFFLMGIFPYQVGIDPYEDCTRVVSGVTIDRKDTTPLSAEDALLIYRMWTDPEVMFKVVDTVIFNGIPHYTIR